MSQTQWSHAQRSISFRSRVASNDLGWPFYRLSTKRITWKDIWSLYRMIFNPYDLLAYDHYAVRSLSHTIFWHMINILRFSALRSSAIRPFVRLPQVVSFYKILRAKILAVTPDATRPNDTVIRHVKSGVDINASIFWGGNAWRFFFLLLSGIKIMRLRRKMLMTRGKRPNYTIFSIGMKSTVHIMWSLELDACFFWRAVRVS